MAKQVEKALASGLKLVVKKDYYLGLWNIKYEDGMKWAGPFKTKKEAVERMEEIED